MSNNSSKKSKYIKNNKLIIIIVLGIIIIVGFILFLNRKTDEINKVSKILNSSFYNIVCIDRNCDEIAAYKGDPNGKIEVVLLNNDGNEVSSYKMDMSTSKTTIEPVGLGNNWFVAKNINNETKKVDSYSIINKKGKEVYKTKEQLKVLTKNIILLNNKNKGVDSYTFLNSNGKELIKNLNDYSLFNDNTIISIDNKGSKQILDENANLLLNGYYVFNDIKDENNNTLYLIIKDSKNNAYNYFSIKNLKIVGDSFHNYKENNDGTLTIYKKENNKEIKYKLYKNGKQELIGENASQSEIVSKIKKNSNLSDYNVYNTGIDNENQNNIFVDNKKTKEFGIYDLKANKFNKIYSYKSNISNYYSSIYSLNNDNDLKYYQISCSNYYCDKPMLLIYDIEKNKLVYKLDNDLIITNYYEYEDGYKVLKYSYSSKNEKYKGKYVLYNNKNEEIGSSTNRIVIIGKKILIGSDSKSNLVLYSIKNNKLVNDDSSLASIITINDKDYYKYSTKEKHIVLNNEGKEVLNINANLQLIYSDKTIVYIDNKNIYIFNGKTEKTKKYVLNDNEKLNDANGSIIPPYRGALFVNNSTDKIVKVVNSNGKTIKTIRQAEIERVNYTSNKNVLIITKRINTPNVTYGLYLAK